jgi:hypothetical protein
VIAQVWQFKQQCHFSWLLFIMSIVPYPVQADVSLSLGVFVSVAFAVFAAEGCESFYPKTQSPCVFPAKLLGIEHG